MLMRACVLIIALALAPWLEARSADKDSLTVASFNIKWIGNYKQKDAKALAGLLGSMDIVLVQELVSPPYPGFYPDDTPFKPTEPSKEFFDHMRAAGFRYVLSEENTGRNTHRKNGAAAEWFVAFYKPDIVCAAGDEFENKTCDASDLPNGFLSNKRVKNASFDRVPYAFAFRAGKKKTDFVLISVHLRPSAGEENVKQRKKELSAISKWIKANAGDEKHILVAGDMNLYSCDELEAAKPAGYKSLNHKCVTTVTGKTPRPFDHVLVPEEHADILHRGGKFKVIDLVAKMCAQWDADVACPGSPYVAAKFGEIYSDHRPVTFEIAIAADTD